ncbi:Pyridoxal-5'-phosphate-dependent enzyme family protein [Raphanus sativus]|uniref:Tryptophan synthase n=1 Tax=Raphanus sativus TaxID=3726 RepID=A0A6J0KQ34_RAPSA|nr:tryptophan synthase beta chain 1 [Raphanus sativus]KAJ4879180.1 Pyridoxal-5'-phosphate-dependent enzyme family protein [Raphanus sativus]
MSSTKIQVRGQPLPMVLTRNHRMINSVVCGVQNKRHHYVSNVLRTIDPPLGSVPTRTDDSQFLRGDGNGRFGRFGGKFVPETLISPLKYLEDEFNFVLSDHEFQEELTTALRDYVGRETPLYFAGRLTEHYKNISQTTGGGPEIYLKREDLSHCGSHKINNALAQAMIARRLGCSRVVAATGAGQHGVATAAACAKLSLECTVFMGSTDIEKQSSNVLSMKLLGAQVKSVEGTFKDASSEAIRNWVGNLETTYYLSGTVVGPHPSPLMVREFQSVIGKETRRQANQLWGGKPDVLVACIGSGSNALGLFHEFVGDEDVRLVGVEAAGLGLDSGKHSATLAVGDVGVYHGSMSYLLQDDQGQILEPHSVGVGLEYPGVGPEISFLKETGRAEFYTATDQEAIQACMLLSRLEGIIPALEASHALAFLDKLVPTLRDGTKVVVNCSGRGDKDLDILIQRGMPSSLR